MSARGAADGLIRGYGRGTGDPQRAAAFADGTRRAVIQHKLNVLGPPCSRSATFHELASIYRSLSAMGLLTGPRPPGTPELGGTAAPEPAGMTSSPCRRAAARRGVAGMAGPA